MDVPSRTSAPTPVLIRATGLQIFLGKVRPFTSPGRGPSTGSDHCSFEELEEKWGKAYPAIPKLWRAAWEQFIPFLDYDVEIRKVLCSTNAIVILSQLQGVVDVADGLDRSPIVRAGRAYLQPSSRHGRGRFGVRCSSGGVRLAA
jgi:hypothetical protein